MDNSKKIKDLENQIQSLKNEAVRCLSIATTCFVINMYIFFNI